MHRKTVAASVAVLALAAAGCGSSGPKQLTTAQFRQQATRICTHRHTAFASAIAKVHGDSLAMMRAALPAYRTSVQQLEAIAPPANLKTAYDSVMAFERLQLKLAQQAMHTGRVPRGAGEDGAPLHRHERMRAQLGMSACN